MISHISHGAMQQPGAPGTARRSLAVLILTALLAACGGGGGASAPVAPPAATTIVKGQVVDDYVAGATVYAYEVTADGTQGTLIAGPFTTDSNGNYSLNLGNYSGPVYLTSTGGTYVDTATGQTVDLTGTGLVLSAIIPNASGTITAEITPVTTMAAQLVATVVQDSSPKISVSEAATAANDLISKYFGIASILNTQLLDLSQAGCATGATPDSIDATLVLAAIGDLAAQYSVSSPDLIQALIQDISSDGIWDGKANGKAISVPTTTGTVVALSLIEGNGLAGVAAAVLAIESSKTNVCQAEPTQLLLTDLANKSLFSVPAAPTGVAATPGAGQIKVSWNAVAGATSYNLYVATAPGVQEVPSGLPGYAIHLNVASGYVLSGLTNGTTYYLVVTAVDGIAGVTSLGSESAVSTEVSATPTAGSAISVSISPSGPQTVAAGGSISFAVTVNGSTNQAVTWSISPSTGCGSVSAANVYTAPSPTATLTCTLTATTVALPAATTAPVVVTVRAQGATLSSISLAPQNMTIAAGATQQFTATGSYSDGSTQNLTAQVTWVSSDPSYATISSAAGTAGLATGVAAGTTVISATLGSVGATTNLTVTAGSTTVTALSTGFGGDMCALLSDGTAKCWGPDDLGSLGDESTNYSIDATPVSAITLSAANPAKGISMSASTCAVLTDGSIQCWGPNVSGTLGNDTTTSSLTAVTAYSNSANPAKQVSVGTFASCAVFHDGTAACWGNDGGNPAAPLLGNGTTGFSLTPVPVSNISAASPATAISIGSSSACALMGDATVQCWGSNNHGELGTGAAGPESCDSLPCSTVPVPVTGLSGVTMVSVGGLADVVCAVKNDGTVWCWGSNMYSQLGNGSTEPYVSSPVQITGLSAAATAVSVGFSSVCALLADGTVQCWGNNQDGQMGNGTTTSPQTSPVTVSNITAANPATAIAVNENSACALLQDGTVECWGLAASGSLGNGETTSNELVPVPVIDL